MIDRVVVVGLTRGGERVSADQVFQMAGRAGRGQRGFFDLVVDPDERRWWASQSAVVPARRPGLSKPEALADYLGSKLCGGPLDAAGLRMVVGRSLSAHMDVAPCDEALRLLMDKTLAEHEDGRHVASDLCRTLNGVGCRRLVRGATVLQRLGALESAQDIHAAAWALAAWPPEGSCYHASRAALAASFEDECARRGLALDTDPYAGAAFVVALGGFSGNVRTRGMRLKDLCGVLRAGDHLVLEQSLRSWL